MPQDRKDGATDAVTDAGTTAEAIAAERARYGRLDKFGWITAEGLILHPSDDPDAPEFDLS